MASSVMVSHPWTCNFVYYIKLLGFGQILMNVVRIEMTVGSCALTPLDPTHVVVVLATDLLQMESHAMVNCSLYGIHNI